MKRYPAIFLWLIACLCSCAGSRSVSNADSSAWNWQTQDAQLSESSGEETETTNPLAPRQVVYNASLKLVVEDPEKLSTPLQSLTEKYQGYVQQISFEQAILRVAAPQLEAALLDLETLGKIKQKNVSGSDVTEFYQDLEIRLENARQYRKRYLEILEAAQNVEEILRIEKELERLNEEIDLLTGKLQSLKDQIALATIQIDIERKVKPGPVGYLFVGLYEAVKWVFVRN